MTYELIKLNDYILAIDESKIKLGDFYLNKNQINQCKKWIYFSGDVCHYTNINNKKWENKKIIAHLPINGIDPIEGIDLLPSLETEENIKNYAIDELETLKVFKLDITKWHIFAFLKGYKRAKTKYAYTKEDLIKALNFGMTIKSKMAKDPVLLVNEHNKFLESLVEKPTYFKPDLELVGSTIKIPVYRIDINNKKMLTGKYIYGKLNNIKNETYKTV